MEYPIVEIKTKDEIVLNGLINEAPDSDTILINIHGTGGNFYEELFIKNLFLELPKIGVSFLSINNRGNSILGDSWQRTGSAIEKFEDCLLDIDSWIEFSLGKKYKKIILQGHSLGTEKIVYYMNNGKYRNKVKSIVLLGFSDSYGCEMNYLRNNKDIFFKEAKELVKSGKSDHLLRTDLKSHAGILPISAGSFLNQFSQNSELSKTFTFHKKKLDDYSNIKIPILAIISDNDKHTAKTIVKNGSEHTSIPLKEACTLLKKENPKTKLVVLNNTNHDFEGKEKELTNEIINFLKNEN